MVADIVDMMETTYDKDTMSLRLPQAFEQLRGKDADFETVSSNSLQPLNLIHNHNVVTRTIVYIFINDSCREVPVRRAHERGDIAYKLFQHVYGFQEVTTFLNLTKDEVIDKLKRLKKIAESFEDEVEARD